MPSRFCTKAAKIITREIERRKVKEAVNIAYREKRGREERLKVGFVKEINI